MGMTREELDELIGPGSNITGPKKFKAQNKKEAKKKMAKAKKKKDKGTEVVSGFKTKGKFKGWNKDDNTFYTSKTYKTKDDAKRAAFAGLMKKLGMHSQESTADNMINLVLEGYDPFEIVNLSMTEINELTNEDETDE